MIQIMKAEDWEKTQNKGFLSLMLNNLPKSLLVEPNWLGDIALIHYGKYEHKDGIFIRTHWYTDENEAVWGMNQEEIIEILDIKLKNKKLIYKDNHRMVYFYEIS